MGQHLPPSKRSNKSKDRSLAAIVLAILLHIMLAIIIYFSVFHHRPATSITDSESKNVSAISSEIKVKAAPDLSHTNTTSNDNTTLVSNEIKDNSASSDMTKTAATTKSSAIHKSTTSVIDRDQNPNKQTADREITTKADTSSATSESMPNDLATPNQKNQPEYTLKQTREYQKLDAEIDKNNEQLVKLIDEVKKRNQQQIKQHQVDIPITSPKTVPSESIKHDYPITPIDQTSE